MIINVDGSCRSNPGPGGVGIYFRECPDYSESIPFEEGLTTNIRMEMMAIAYGVGRGISLIETFNLPREVKILTDSKFSVDMIYQWLPSWVKNGFKKANGQPVQNQDIIVNCIIPMLSEVISRKISLFIEYIPREENCEADQLARTASAQASEILKPLIEEFKRRKDAIQLETARTVVASAKRLEDAILQSQIQSSFNSLTTPSYRGQNNSNTNLQHQTVSSQLQKSKVIIVRI